MRRLEGKSSVFAGITALLWACSGCTLDTGTESEDVESVQQALGYNWQSGMGSDWPASFLGGDPVCETRMPYPLDSLGWFIGRTRLASCAVAISSSGQYTGSSFRTLHGGPLFIGDSAFEPPTPVTGSDGQRQLCIDDGPSFRGQPGYVVGGGLNRRCRIRVITHGVFDSTNFKYIVYSVI